MKPAFSDRLMLVILALPMVGLCNAASSAVVREGFESMPMWDSSYSASWGGTASFSIAAGGESGDHLQASMTGNGSCARVRVYPVPTDTWVHTRVFMRCPASSLLYWMEAGLRMGNHTAEDFEQSSGSWSLIRKFDGFEESEYPNGNGGIWTKYGIYNYTGAQTEISIGYKIGSVSGTGTPTLGWDSLGKRARVREHIPQPPPPTPSFVRRGARRPSPLRRGKWRGF